MARPPVELVEVLVEPKNFCYVCCGTSESVQKSPCVCKTLYVCEGCLRKLKSESTVCTVCRTPFENENHRESEIDTLIRLRRSLKTSVLTLCGIGILALLVFGVGILVFAMDQEKWPKIVPEMYGTIFLYGFFTVMIVAFIIKCMN